MASPEAMEVPESYIERIVDSNGADPVYTQVFDILDPAIFGILPRPEGIAAGGYINRFVPEWYGRENELRQSLDQVVSSYLSATQHRDSEIAAVYFGPSAALEFCYSPHSNVFRLILPDLGYPVNYFEWHSENADNS